MTNPHCSPFPRVQDKQFQKLHDSYCQKKRLIPEKYGHAVWCVCGVCGVCGVVCVVCVVHCVDGETPHHGVVSPG